MITDSKNGKEAPLLAKLDSMNEEQEDQMQALDSPRLPYPMNSNVIQMAVINKMLPKGFRFEIQEVVKRQMEVHTKKTSGLANYNTKKPEIHNEVRQQRLL